MCVDRREALRAMPQSDPVPEAVRAPPSARNLAFDGGNHTVTFYASRWVIRPGVSVVGPTSRAIIARHRRGVVSQAEAAR